MRAAKFTPSRELAAVYSGGCGRCTGLGLATMFGIRKKRPW